MKKEDVVILGAGAASLELLEIIDAINQQGRERIRCVAFLDDDPELRGTAIAGIPVEGGIEEMRRWSDARCIHSIGNPTSFVSREHIWKRTGLGIDRFASLVHPTAVISPRAQLGQGSIIYSAVVIGASARLGICSLLLPACVISHDVVLGDFTSLASGVLVASGTRVGKGCYLGAGCTLIGNTIVEDGALIGIGAVVLDTVKAGERVVGNPARPIASRS